MATARSAALSLVIGLAALPAAATGETRRCSITDICETGAACGAIPMDLGLRVSDDAQSAVLTQLAGGAEFRLARVSHSATVATYAGAGDRDRAAVLVALWKDGAVQITTLDLTDPSRRPAVLLGQCQGAAP